MMDNERMDTSYPKIDLSEFLRGMVKTCRAFIIPGMILTALAAIIMGIFTYIRYTPMYCAEAAFTVKVTDSFYASQQYYNSSAAKQVADAFPNIITSGVLGEKVKEELCIDDLPSISAKAMGRTNVIILSVSSSDPELAYKVLNCVMEIYPSVAEFVIGPTELSLLSETGVPSAPYSNPGYSSAGIKGAFFGIAVWVGGSFIYWITHRTIENEEQLKKFVNVPCLCRIPTAKGQRKEKCPIVTEAGDKFGFGEAVRILRLRVEKALAGDKKVVMVTSAIQNEGKTAVSVNLAMALAQNGKKTLLVDCDLRNPSVEGIFKTEKGPGFTEYLCGKCGFEEIVRKIDRDRFFVVFGGAPVPEPEKLLANKNMEDFIEEAKSSFDCIILDTPPCAIMADAAEIGVLSDCALFTVRQDFASRAQIAEGIRNISDTGKPIIGCVLNMAARFGKDSYCGYGHEKKRGGEEE